MFARGGAVRYHAFGARTIANKGETMALTADQLSTICALDANELAARAVDLRASRGYNCAQGVACAFAPYLGMDETLLFQATEGFGSGMGGTTETCGAITGAFVVLGLVNSAGPETPTTKGATYALNRALLKKWREKNATTICRELKGVGTGQVIRTCPGCIEDAVHFTLDILKDLAGK